MQTASSKSSIEATPAAGDAARVDPAAAPAAKSPLRLFRRFLLRGETAVASVGIALAAILLGSMAAAGWWTLRTQQAAEASARAEQVKAAAAMLAQCAEPLLAHNERAALQRLMLDAGRAHDLSTCQIVLTNGNVVAASDGSRLTPNDKLPADWGKSHLPPLAPTPRPAASRSRCR